MVTKPQGRLLALILAFAVLGACATTPQETTTSTASGATTATTAGSAETTGPTATTAAASGKTDLVVGLGTEPDTLDMTVSSSSLIPIALLYNVLEPLVKIGPDGSINPLLAESWDVSDDGLTYTFTLREANFHDGQPFTAADVKYTYERAMDPAQAHPFARYFSVVDQVTATDDRTVVVQLNTPSNNFLYNMGLRAGAIYQEGSVDSLADGPIGTGPFRFVEWQRGSSITVEANPDYWGEGPFLTEVTFRFFSDRDAGVNAMLAGDLDMMPIVLNPPRVAEFRDNPDFVLTELPSNELVWVNINHEVPLLQDVRIRQAMSLAVDREASIAALNGERVLAGPHVPPPDPWMLQDSTINDYDPERARELLAEAGYPDGIDVVMRVPGTPKLPPVAEIVVAQWAEVGIRATLQVDDVAVWFEEVRDPERSEYEVTTISDVNPRAIHAFQNPEEWWHYYNEDLAQLLAEADSALTEEERTQKYEEAQLLLAEEMPLVWLWANLESAVFKPGLSGYTEMRIDNAADLTQVRWDG
jgi:peptide/nickel transport system substrate-binding protein